MIARIESLGLVHQACWQQLGLACHDKAHGWRLMGLATLGQGELGQPSPELRTVVLRELDLPEQSLLFFTDARSPKVAQLAAQPQASLLLWCARLGWQLRLKVVVEVHTSGLAVSSRWARLKMTPAAHDYLSPLVPGAPLTSLTPYEPDRATREHFALCSARVMQIDWLELHADGHRRARFDGAGQGQWINP